MKPIFQIPALLLTGAAAGFLLRGAPAVSPATDTSSHSPAGGVAGIRSPVAANPGAQFFRPASGRIGRSDADAFLGQLRDTPGLDERARKLMDFMKAWASSDGKAALEYALSMSDSSGYLKIEAVTAVSGVLAASDPQYLAKIAATTPANASRQAMILALAKQWSDSDLPSAIEWAEKLPDDRGKADALAALRGRLAHEDPEAASQVLTRMPAGFARQNLLGKIAVEWGLRAPKDALAWIKTLPTGEQQVAIPALAGAWAEDQPVEAGGFIADLPAGEMQNRAAMSVVANWASQDPKAAANWAADFPADGLRELGVREAMNSWSRVDADGALDWAKKLPNPDARDVALKSYAESVAYWAPDRTAAMVDMIQDPVRREQSMEMAMQSWSEIDPQAAEKWLSHLNVRDGLRNRLRAVLSQGQAPTGG
jgi:hypothetical protein